MMRVVVPQTNVDALMTEEDFNKQLEKYVNKENSRLLGLALLNVTTSNNKVTGLLLSAISKLKILSLEQPELAGSVIKDLTDASATLCQLTKVFEQAKAASEATYEQQH